MKSLESYTCHTKALPRCHTDYSCHTDSPPCHTDSHCHTERSEVSQNIESSIDSKRDFSPTAQNDKERVTQNDNAPPLVMLSVAKYLQWNLDFSLTLKMTRKIVSNNKYNKV